MSGRLDLALHPGRGHLLDLEHDTRLLRYLGPRVHRRHRRPAAARVLRARRRRAHPSPWPSTTTPHGSRRPGSTGTDPEARRVRAYSGTFRIQPHARPVRRALLLDRPSRLDPPPELFVGRDGTALRGQRIANRVRAASDRRAMPRHGRPRSREVPHAPRPSLWNDSRLPVARWVARRQRVLIGPWTGQFRPRLLAPRVRRDCRRDREPRPSCPSQGSSTRERQPGRRAARPGRERSRRRRR